MNDESNRIRENRTLEFKEDLTNTFLKTVSAFSNYDGGIILFGVNDCGIPVGLGNPKQTCLDIENKINDSIHPQPDYSLKIDGQNKTVELKVNAGKSKPYTYKSKAYKRNDTATIEVDELEFSRLVLQGKNIRFEQLSSENQNLKFSVLEEKLIQKIGIDRLDKNILKTLNLFSDSDGFNHAAELLSDSNDFPGIDITKFGESISVIQKRATFEHESILKELSEAVNVYKDFYQYEEINGIERKKIERIPENAFRETLANALIHRTWDVNAQIRVLMFDDRIEITSPGGLSSGISEEEYLKGNVSILRNPIIGNVFYRLHIVEILGTGIPRINEAYRNSAKKPRFEIFENSIKVTLPVTDVMDLTKDEKTVLAVLSKNIPRQISGISASVPFGKSKLTELLKSLESKNYITIQGNGRGTKYCKN